jgi:hypothetical protein
MNGGANKIVPVDPYCAKKRALDNSIDFPQFSQPQSDCAGYPDVELSLCKAFEREILGPMGATHVVMNIGWHAGLEERADKSGTKGMGKYFLQKVIDGAAENFAPYNPVPRNNSDMEKYHKPPSHHKRDASASSAARPPTTSTTTTTIAPYTLSRRNLPKVTWRATTCCGPHRYGDAVAQKYQNASLNEHATKYGDREYGTVPDRRLGIFEIWDSTNELWNIQKKLKAKDDKWLLATVERHGSWSSVLRGRNRDLYRHAETKDGKLNVSIIQTIWTDHAHLEPWVYAELHNVFFNAVCEV